jgi:hypothetical protein
LFYVCGRENQSAVNWAETIERNCQALARIVAALAAMAGLAERLPMQVYRTILRGLRPAESAVRRLIVIAARGLKVDLPPDRPKRQARPDGQAPAGKRERKRGGRVSFQLFDTRKRIPLKPGLREVVQKEEPRPYLFAEPEPRYANIQDGSVVLPWLKPPPPADPAPAPVQPPPPDPGTIDATRLGRRLAAVAAALADMPGQALRFARWQARRERIKLTRPTAFTSPLRIGRPPGLRKKPRDEVELVLKECHALACDVLRDDTS